MSSPERLSRRRLLALFAATPLLAGCSFTPLYGGGDDMSAGPGFAYAEPRNRVEQIIYQELAFRLGRNASPDAPLVTVRATEKFRRVGRTSASSVLTAYEAEVTANLTVSRPEAEKPVLSARRFAASSYEISGQVAADNAAKADAAEKAARAVADTLRLVLLAALKSGEIDG